MSPTLVIVWLALSIAGIFGQASFLHQEPEEVSCPNPPKIDTAFLRHGAHEDLYRPGHKLCYQCIEGLVPYDNLVGIFECSPEGKWTEVSLLDCTIPDAPVEGIIIDVNKTHPTVAPDFFINTCGPPPTQEVPMVLCSKPEVLEGTTIESVGGDSFYPGSIVTYRCADGYVAAEAQEAIAFCQDNGTWTVVELSCDPVPPLKDCGDPPTLDFGKVIYNKKDDIYLYSCNEEYVLEDPDIYWYVCDWETGTWINKGMPRCIRKPVVCGPPPEIPHAYINSTEEGHTYIYACNKGFSLLDINNNKIQCEQSTSLWTGVQGHLPQCIKDVDQPHGIDGEELKNCGEVPSIPNGSFVFDKDTGRYVFSCEEGYDVVGLDWIQCVDNKWIGGHPYCDRKPVECGPPPEILHAHIMSNDGGHTYTIGCDRGYILQDINSNKIQCKQSTGLWTGVQGSLPQCIKDVDQPEDTHSREFPNCTEVPSIPNGSPVFDKDTGRYVFSCEEGYDVVGLDWVQCVDSEWIGGPPYCDLARCPDPGVPENGRRIGNSFKYKDTVEYVCYSGYVLYGSQKRTCQRNRKWTGAPVTCDGGDHFCPVPAVPDGGMKHHFGYNQGDGVRFTCEPGSVRYGSAVRTCLANHKWSGEQPVCDAPLAKDTDDEIHQRLDQMLTDLKLMSHKGVNIYFVIDASNSIEEEEYRNSVNFAIQIIEELGVAPDSPMGAVFAAMTFASDPRVVFNTTQCLNTRQCQDMLKNMERGHNERRGTNLKKALVKVKKMATHTRKHQPSRSSSKRVIILFSDGIHNEGGSPLMAADALKMKGWEIFAVSVKTSNHPKNMKSKLALLASSPTRNHVVFTTDFNWEHVLDYSQCGDPGRSTKISDEALAEATQAGAWPWVARLYVHNQQNGHYEVSCGAALVDSLHIITAASCLHGTGSPSLPRVKFVSVDGFEDSRSQSRNVVKIYPDGNPSDRGLVLLKLDRPVTLNREVRTVCLPKQELKEGHAIVLGWCYENGTVPSKLHQSQVQITSQNICGRPRQRSEEHQTFCIKSQPADQGACGSPCTKGSLVVVEHVDPVSRHSHWELAGVTQAAAVGCGLASSMGVSLHPNMEWIQNALNSVQQDEVVLI